MISIEKSQRDFVHEYGQALMRGKAAALIGSGFSVEAGLPTWSNLLEDSAAENLGIDITKEKDFVSIAQYIKNESGMTKLKYKIAQSLKNANAVPSSKHIELAQLPIHTFWTTNYDCLIENSLRKIGKSVEVKVGANSLAKKSPNAEVLVYKMHGDISLPKSIVLTKDDYELYFHREELFREKLKSDLLDNTFMFVGFSFTDPNIMYIMGNLRVLLHGKRGHHYWIIKGIEQAPNETELDFQHRKKMFHLRIKDMKNYGIYAVIVREYSEIDNLIHKLTDYVRRRRIFISGAVVDPAPYSHKQVRTFIKNIIFEILRHGGKIINGFGVGIGDYVYNAVFEFVQETAEGRNIEDITKYIEVRPFPEAIRKGSETMDERKYYREALLREVGIVLFLFGNKIESNKKNFGTCCIVPSNGMDDEFEIAKKNGALMIPICATRWKAKEYCEKLIKENPADDVLNGLISSDSLDETEEIVIKAILDYQDNNI